MLETERFDDGSRAQVEDFTGFQNRLELFIFQFAGAKRIDTDTQWMWNADRVRNLDFALLGETGSEQRNQTRLSNVLDQLHKHGIVSPPDKENQILIRPIIVHLANPDQLMLLLAHFKALAAAHPSDAEPVESPAVSTDTDV